MSDVSADSSKPASGGRGASLAFGAALLLAAGAYGAYWWTYARHFVSTDNAYASGNIIQISSPIAGRIIGVSAEDTQAVHARQVLVKLDQTDARVALDQARAALGQAVRQVRTLYSANEPLRAAVIAREQDLHQTEDGLARRIAAGGAVPREEVERARMAVNAAKAALLAARSQLEANETLAGKPDLATHPGILQASAAVRAAYLAYARSIIDSPVDGYVAQRAAQIGQLVGPGTPLMAVVPLDQVWVDANFTEVQLQRVRVGQTVKLTADLYGPDVVYEGTVAGFSAGTGGAFSLLPAQNASGNWIKVVQRLPVRVVLKPDELKAHPLRIGLSMHARIDLRRQDGGVLSAPPPLPTYETDVYERLGREADAMVAQTLREAGAEPAAPAPTR